MNPPPSPEHGDPPPGPGPGQAPGPAGRDAPAAGADLALQLFDAAPIILTVADADLHLRAVNRTFSEATGLSAQDAVGGHVPDWYPTTDPDHWQTVRQVLATGEPVHDAVVRHRQPADPSDESVWRFSCYPLRDSSGATVAVGLAAVDVTEERRAQAERDLAWQRLRLLSRASGLLGESLDLSATLRELATLLVPEFADACGMFLADEPHPRGAAPAPLALRPLGWAQAPAVPDAAPGAGGPLPDTPIDVTGTPLARVCATGRPLLLDLAEPLAALGLPYLADDARRLRLRQAIVVPLLHGADCLGCALFGVTTAHRLGDQDLEAAAELGSRCAAAIANAHAYEDQRTAARTLQRALRPHGLPTVTGLDLVWRSRPAAGGDEVGGDWLDVIPLPAGRAALVIGDAMGHGLNAAAAMGQLRTATRTLALLALSPADVLTTLDTVTHGIDTLASMIYAIFDPGAHLLTIANAGHPPPALRRPDGAVRLLDDTDGIMLGVGEAAFTEIRQPFPPGCTLALYTDGVVETPTVDLGTGSRRLLRTLADGTDLAATADRLLALVDEGDAQDDATVLLARAHPDPDRH
jgi:PAS domain S-box-containing protein